MNEALSVSDPLAVAKHAAAFALLREAVDDHTDRDLPPSDAAVKAEWDRLGEVGRRFVVRMADVALGAALSGGTWFTTYGHPVTPGSTVIRWHRVGHSCPRDTSVQYTWESAVTPIGGGH